MLLGLPEVFIAALSVWPLHHGPQLGYKGPACHCASPPGNELLRWEQAAINCWGGRSPQPVVPDSAEEEGGGAGLKLVQADGTTPRGAEILHAFLQRHWLEWRSC